MLNVVMYILYIGSKPWEKDLPSDVEMVWSSVIPQAINELTQAVLCESDREEDWSLLSEKVRAFEKEKERILPVFLLYQNFNPSLINVLRSFTYADGCKATEKKNCITFLEVKLAQLKRMNFHRHNPSEEIALQQREDFLNVCAHDLRSPLGLIESSLSLLLSTPLNAYQNEIITRARRQGAHALSLVNDLLDVMSYEKGLKPDYEMVPLHSFLKDFHEDHLIQAKQKGVDFHYENDVKSLNVLGDKDRLEQLLKNLFSNALKYTEAGKNIFLKVRLFNGRRKSDPPYPMVIISLQDEGPGISPQDIPKIFDKYSQLRSSAKGEGKGLGLTVAKQISKLHDGNVWVESVSGKGSIFHVLLRYVVSEPSKTSVRVGKLENIKKILVIEPDEQRRELYFECLKSWGFETSFVSNGVEAVASTFYNIPDIIILTHGISKISEIQVANLLKGNPTTSHIPILYAIKDEKLGTRDLLIDRVLLLPYSRETFYSCVRLALQKAAA